MPVADELVTILGVDIAKNALAKLEAFKQGVDSVKKTLVGLSVAVTGFATATAVLVKGASDEAMELEKLSEKTKVSTDALQEWNYVAQQSGVAASSVQGDMAKLSQSFFRTGKDVDAELTRMARQLQGMSEPMAKAYGQMRGISEDTVRVLRKGPEAIEELREEAHKLGGIIPEESIKLAADFKRQIGELRFALHGLTTQVAIALMPALSRVMDIFKRWMIDNREWIAMGLHAIMIGIVDGFERFWAILSKIGEAFQPVLDVLQPFIGDMEMSEWVTHLVTGALEGLLIIFAPLIAKIALIGAGVAIASIIFEDLFSSIVHGKGAFADFFNYLAQRWPDLFAALGQLWDWFESKIGPAIDALGEGLAWLGNEFAEIGAQIMDVFNEIAGPIAEFFGTFEEKYPKLSKALKDLASILGDTVAGAFKLVINNIKILIKVLGEVLGFIGKVIVGVADFLEDLFSANDEADKLANKEGKQERAAPPINAKTGKPISARHNESLSKADSAEANAPISAQYREDKETSSAALTAATVTAVPVAAKTQPNNTYNDNKTINQNISTSDPVQAGQTAAAALNGPPPNILSVNGNGM